MLSAMFRSAAWVVLIMMLGARFMPGAQAQESLDALPLPPAAAEALKAAGYDPSLVIVLTKDGAQRLYNGDPAKAPFESLADPIPPKTVEPLGELVAPADGSALRYCYKCGGRWCYLNLAL